MSAAHDICRALQGRWHRNAGVARCPAHDDRSPSLSLRETADGRILVHCHAGCEQRVVIDSLSRLGLWDKPARAGAFETQRPAPVADNSKDEAQRSARALSIWAESRLIDGTVAATYLADREIDLDQLPLELDRALRWHPRCPWETRTHGCMVALMTDAVTGEPRAIHRTAITANGDKIGRKMLGPAKGCVIRLWLDEAVTDGLVIGEGIETTLAAATRIEHRATLLQPAWAAATAGLLAALPVLSGIEALTILVDRDESGAGQKAAAECAAQWSASGREVIRLTPNQMGDFNDVVEARRAA